MTTLRSTAALALVGAALSGLSACSAAPPMEYADSNPGLAYAPPPVYDVAPPPLYVPPPVVVQEPQYVAPPQYSSPRRAVDCDIRVRSTREGVSITPVALLDRPVSGEYDLVLTKSGASGSSDVTQGGPFRAAAGERVTLGQTELSLGRRDHYRVVLTLTDRGREICRREVRS